MHTSELLALELEKAGLPELAVQARAHLFHDFLSPHATPAALLSKSLAAAGTPAALALRARHHVGEFDATPEESEAWAESPEGRASFDQLFGKA